MAEVEARKAAVSRVPQGVNFQGRLSNFLASRCGVIRITARHSLWPYLLVGCANRVEKANVQFVTS